MISEEPSSDSVVPDRYCWIPTSALEPDMVIARPIQGGHGNQLTLRIAVGSSVTANTIAQLLNKGVECIAVCQDAMPDEAALAAAAVRHEQRLAEIFGDQPDDACRSLRDALRAYGPSAC